MKPDATTSRHSSTTTSRSAPQQQAELPTDAPRSLSEAQYLREQAANARAAAGQAFGDLTGSLKNAADPHRLTRDHPWWAVAAATVAGFAAAAAFVPTKEEQALRKLAALEKALRKEASGNDSSPAREEEDTSDKKRSWLKTIGLEIFHTIRPALMSLVTAGLSGMNAKPEESVPPETQNRNQKADEPLAEPADISSPS